MSSAERETQCCRRRGISSTGTHSCTHSFAFIGADRSRALTEARGCGTGRMPLPCIACFLSCEAGASDLMPLVCRSQSSQSLHPKAGAGSEEQENGGCCFPSAPWQEESSGRCWRYAPVRGLAVRYLPKASVQCKKMQCGTAAHGGFTARQGGGAVQGSTRSDFLEPSRVYSAFYTACLRRPRGSMLTWNRFSSKFFLVDLWFPSRHAVLLDFSTELLSRSLHPKGDAYV